MSVQYGVTSSGFVMKPFTECLAEVNAQMQSIFGATIDLSPSQPFGQWAQAQADREFALWQLAQSLFTARDPDGASGAGLDELCAITGTVRLTPTSSTTNAVFAGVIGTSITTAFQAAANPNGLVYQCTNPGTLGPLNAYSSPTLFAQFALITNAGNVYCAGFGGTSTGIAPTGTGVTTDGAIPWLYIGAGTGGATLPMASVAVGVQQAISGALTQIVTPIVGLNAVNNPSGFTAGILFENDSALRLRRIVELNANGAASTAAIAGAIETLTQVPTVTLPVGLPAFTIPYTYASEVPIASVSVYENPTDFTDAFGVPPHSINPVVQYSNFPTPNTQYDSAIAAAIFNKKAAGIRSSALAGGPTYTVTDQAGYAHSIGFDYPAGQWLWIYAQLTRGANYVGDVTVKQALFNWSVGLSGSQNPGVPYSGTVGSSNQSAGSVGANLPFPGYTVGASVSTGQLYSPLFDEALGISDVISLTTAITAVGASNPGSGTVALKTLLRNQIAILNVSQITLT